MLDIKKIIPLLFFTPLPLLAYDYNSSEYKEFINNQYLEYKQAYQAKSKACYEQGLNAKFSDESVSKIKSLNLTKEELEASVIYFLYEANLKCQGILPIMTVGSLNEARTLGLTPFSEKADPDFKNLKYLLIDTQAILRGKYVFMQLPKDKQDALNSIKEFKKPFSLEFMSKLSK